MSLVDLVLRERQSFEMPGGWPLRTRRNAGDSRRTLFGASVYADISDEPVNTQMRDQLAALALREERNA